MKKLRGEWDDYGRPAAIGEDAFDAAFSKVIAGEITTTELRKEFGIIPHDVLSLFGQKIFRKTS